jgi:putative endonuclease
MFYTYVIQSESQRYYIGSTNDLNKRIKDHNRGLSKWTSRYKNWKLIYFEKFSTRKEAIIRENKIKKQKGGVGFFNIINSQNYNSKKRHGSSGG